MLAKIRLSIVLLSMAGLAACADIGYYLHSVKGHFNIIQQKRNIDEILQDEAIPDQLKQRLRRVQDIRSFAFAELKLPESDSYTEFADLKRSYALQNLFAAEEFSVKAKQWCYPVVGCAGYRGFFDQQRLEAFVSELREQHYDVYVANVSAYSTLGWFDDPVLNTFINWPDELLAGLIFHELAHQQLYVDGDSRFNESFATAVQHAGVEKWLQQQGLEQQLERYRQRRANRQKVFDLIKQARVDLQALYQRDIADEEKRRLKLEYLQDLKQRYQAFSEAIQHSDGFQRWFDGELNNAKLVSVSTYNDWVPVFEQILLQQQGDFAAFYKQVLRLSELPRQQRLHCFNDWVENPRSLIGDAFCAQN
jgi:predicted aminopeptidase